MKILYIDSWNNVGDFFRKKREEVPCLNSYGLYKNDGLINKMFRYIGLHIYKPVLYFCYGSWKKNIRQYDLFIIESRKTFEYLISYINKVCPGKRIVVWYWNEVTPREMNPTYIREKYKCETWTFDKKDSEKYNMFYNNTYFFDSIKLEESDTKYDVFYIGIDREGRIKIINKLKKIFSNKKINYSFNLTKSPIKKADKNFIYSNYIPYEKTLDLINKSNTILDLTKKSQYGLTLRPVEALFFQKKLITDNKNIKEYDFYNKDNIFILGEDNIENINKFLGTEYKQISPKIKEKYTFEKWIDRLINKQEYK